MNERIRQLAEQAGGEFYTGFFGSPNSIMFKESNLEKFAQLIIGECINQAHSVGDLRGANDDVIYGADTAAVKISKHFGVEE